MAIALRICPRRPQELAEPYGLHIAVESDSRWRFATSRAGPYPVFSPGAAAGAPEGPRHKWLLCSRLNGWACRGSQFAIAVGQGHRTLGR